MCRYNVFFSGKVNLSQTQEQIEKNLLKQFRVATGPETVEGLAWYAKAKQDLQSLGAPDVYPEYKLVQLIRAVAVLSPQKRWSQQWSELLDYLAIHSVPELDRVRVRGYYTTDAQAEKAYQCLDGVPVKMGIKVGSFYQNILHPEISGPVTVDIWACRHALKLPHNHKMSPSKGLYRKIETAFQVVSAQLGMKPHELQAILWVAARNTAQDARK